MKLEFRGVTIETSDRFQQAQSFYSALLGDPKFVDDNAWAPFEAAAGVNVNLAGPRESTGHDITLSVKTDDLEEAIQYLEKAGAVVTTPIEQGGHQRHAVLRDPAGIHLAVYAPLPN